MGTRTTQGCCYIARAKWGQQEQKERVQSGVEVGRDAILTERGVQLAVIAVKCD